MTQLVAIFGVCLGGAPGMALSFEALTVGGVLLVFAVAGGIARKDLVGPRFQATV